MFNTIQDIKKYAKNKNILLLNDDVIDYIKRRIKLFGLNKILEIDEPLAYSIVNFASDNDDVKITDFELTRDNFMDNIKIIKDFNLADNVTVFFTDLNSISFNSKYNLILVNMINKNHLKLFDKLKDLLEENGFIIVTNVNYYNKLKKLKKENDSKELDEYLVNIEKIIKYFDESDEFLVDFIDASDGLIVAQKIIK